MSQALDEGVVWEVKGKETHEIGLGQRTSNWTGTHDTSPFKALFCLLAGWDVTYAVWAVDAPGSARIRHLELEFWRAVLAVLAELVAKGPGSKNDLLRELCSEGDRVRRQVDDKVEGASK